MLPRYLRQLFTYSPSRHRIDFLLLPKCMSACTSTEEVLVGEPLATHRPERIRVPIAGTVQNVLVIAAPSRLPGATHAQALPQDHDLGERVWGTASSCWMHAVRSDSVDDMRKVWSQTSEQLLCCKFDCHAARFKG